MSANKTPAPARKPQKRFELLPTLLIAGLLVVAVIGMTWYVGYRLSFVAFLPQASIHYILLKSPSCKT